MGNGGKLKVVTPPSRGVGVEMGFSFACAWLAFLDFSISISLCKRTRK